MLTKGHGRLYDAGEAKLLGFLEARRSPGRGPNGVASKETLRGFYDQPVDYLNDLAANLIDREMSPGLRKLGRTLRRWHHEIVAWHQAHISNEPTEATNSLIELIKRVGCGFRRFRNFRLRVLR